MADVKVNRELFSLLLEDLEARHTTDLKACSCVTRQSPCPSAQRLERAKALLERKCGAQLEVTLSTSKNTTHSLKCHEPQGPHDLHRTPQGTTWR